MFKGNIKTEQGILFICNWHNVGKMFDNIHELVYIKSNSKGAAGMIICGVF